MHALHAIRSLRDHDLDDVPEGLEWDERDTDDQKPSWFAGAQKDDSESKFEHGNGTQDIITDHEWEQGLSTRAATLKPGLAWTNEVIGGRHLMGKLFGHVLISSVCLLHFADVVW